MATARTVKMRNVAMRATLLGCWATFVKGETWPQHVAATAVVVGSSEAWAGRKGLGYQRR